MDVVGRSRGKEDECAGHVVGCSPAAGGDPLENLSRPCFVFSELLRVVRGDVSGSDRVYVYVTAHSLASAFVS